MPEQPPEDRGTAKRDADKAVWFFNRCVALRLTRAEAVDLTVAYLLAGMARAEEPERESWEPT